MKRSSFLKSLFVAAIVPKDWVEEPKPPVEVPITEITHQYPIPEDCLMKPEPWDIIVFADKRGKPDTGCTYLVNSVEGNIVTYSPIQNIVERDYYLEFNILTTKWFKITADL